MRHASQVPDAEEFPAPPEFENAARREHLSEANALKAHRQEVIDEEEVRDPVVLGGKTCLSHSKVGYASEQSGSCTPRTQLACGSPRFHSEGRAGFGRQLMAQSGAREVGSNLSCHASLIRHRRRVNDESGTTAS